MKHPIAALLIIFCLSFTFMLSSCSDDEITLTLQNLITEEVNLIRDIAVFQDDSYLAITHGGNVSHAYRFNSSHARIWDIEENPTFTHYQVTDNAIYLLTGASGITGHELIQLSESGEELMRFEVAVDADLGGHYWHKMKVLSDQISFISADASQTEENIFYQTAFSLEGEKLQTNSLTLPGAPIDNYMDGSMMGDDGSMVVSLTDSNGSRLLKYENNEMAWSCSINEGTTRTQEIIQDHQGNYIYVGFEFIDERARGLIGKVDADGNQLWEKAYTTSGNESRFETIIPDAQGGYFILGFNNDNYPDEINKNIWLLKVDENGEVLWQRTHSDAHVAFSPLTIAQRSDGSLLVGGSQLDETSYGGFVMAFDQSGNPMNR